MNKNIRKVWFFKSSSSSRQYQTLLYEDCSTSCDCPGWTKCEKMQVMPGPVVRTAEEAAEFTKRFKQQSTRPAVATPVRAFNFDD
jgi:hypothetical protein